MPTSDIAFTPAVKTAQEERGSRKGYAGMESRGGWADVVTQPKYAGPGGRAIDPYAFEYGGTVMQGVRKHMDRSLLPRDHLAVEPDDVSGLSTHCLPP